MNPIELAREAGFNASNGFSLLIVRHSNGSWVDVSEELTHFAALVRNATLEEAAEYFNDGWASPDCYEIAAAIRALKGKQ